MSGSGDLERFGNMDEILWQQKNLMKRATFLTIVVLASLSTSTPSFATNPAMCLGCHHAGSRVAPNLVGMPVGQFTDAINAFKTGTRPSRTMRGIASRLSDADVAQLAAYFAARR